MSAGKRRDPDAVATPITPSVTRHSLFASILFIVNNLAFLLETGGQQPDSWREKPAWLTLWLPAPPTSSPCPCTELLGPGARGAFSELGSQCMKENTGACGGGTPRCLCKHLFTNVRAGWSVSVHVDTLNTQTRVEPVPPC